MRLRNYLKQMILVTQTFLSWNSQYYERLQISFMLLF